MKKFWLQTSILVLFNLPTAFVQAQYQQLDSIEKSGNKFYFSKGHATRATDLAALSTDAITYHQGLLGFKPDVSFLVLSQDDWSKYTGMPVYGMPHYTGEKVLVVAAEDNAFWKSFIPPLVQIPPALAENIRKAYQHDGQVSMQAFFDLLALHELGHAFHQQAGLVMQRKWMGEFFCNLFLHTYIAEKRPDLLLALKVFPEMVVAGGKDDYTYTSLEQFEMHYMEIATKHPKNYGWYQSRFHVGAGAVYDKGDKMVLENLWLALKEKQVMDDALFSKYLSEKVSVDLGEMMSKW